MNKNTGKKSNPKSIDDLLDSTNDLAIGEVVRPIHQVYRAELKADLKELIMSSIPKEEPAPRQNGPIPGFKRWQIVGKNQALKDTKQAIKDLFDE